MLSFLLAIGESKHIKDKVHSLWLGPAKTTRSKLAPKSSFRRSYQGNCCFF